MRLRWVTLVAAVGIVALVVSDASAQPEPAVSTTHLFVTVTGKTQGTYQFTARSFDVKGVSSGSTGTHSYTPFVMTRGIDQGGSPKIVRSFAIGEELTSVRIDVLDVTAAVLWSYRLGDAYVLSIRHGNDAELPTEEIQFGYSSIEFIFGTDVIPDRSQRQGTTTPTR